ncbi:MAG: hypothetical protein KME55_09195 [Nostoc indistinguendum CM1-VF10]|nr:hypothetical protein [Nostoc indistinguendum CM1-VF10]
MPVDTMALLVDTMALPVDTITLLVDTMALQVKRLVCVQRSLVKERDVCEDKVRF